MGADPMARVRAHGMRGWWAVALLLLAPRLVNLAGPIDDPHSWRQCDTAYYSLHMVRHGIDLLRPEVCWLGAHGALALEFPLPEAVSALLQRTLGIGVVWDRVVSLLFFGIAVLYLHAIARRVLPPRPARIATLAYLALPLGIYYSRAAIVDFAAVAFAHAFLWHGLKAVERRRGRDLALCALSGSLGALIKAPALLPVAMALAWVTLRSGRTAWWRGALPFAVTAAVFALWRAHVEALNSSAPDWSFIPGYHKIAGRWSWYFGEQLASRLDVQVWLRLLLRMILEVTTWPGLLLAFWGAWGWHKVASPAGREAGLLQVWAAGTLIYLVVFWPLNLEHDYYQIPFLAPAAVAIGAGGARLFPPAGRPGLWRSVAARAALAILALFGVLAAFALGYFRVDIRLVTAGREIARLVPSQDLMIAAFDGSRYADPRLLFRADRRGWSLDVTEVTPQVVRGLRREGARWVALLTTPGTSAPPAFLDSLRVARIEGGSKDEPVTTERVLDVYSLTGFR